MDKITGTRKQSRRKLYDRYTNALKYKKDKKPALRSNSPPDSVSVGSSTPTYSEYTDDAYNEAMETSRSFLLYHSEKSDVLQMHWNKSFEFRKQYFQTTGDDLTEILQNWPIIMKPIGSELVSLFNALSMCNISFSRKQAYYRRISMKCFYFLYVLFSNTRHVVKFNFLLL